jgi:hypothetical protein
LVPGVLAWRWVSGAYPWRDAHCSHRVAHTSAIAWAICVALSGEALAVPGSPGETARMLIAELERGGTAQPLVRPALTQAKDALSRAERAAPTRAPLLEAAALEWAQVARDLARASAAERASDRLEQAASATQTEIARLRAAVEQAMGRVGRARQELQQLEAVAPGAASPRSPKESVATPSAAATMAGKIPAATKPAAPVGAKPNGRAASQPGSSSPPTAGPER